MRVKGKQNSLLGPVINCFVIPPNSKIKQTIYGCRLTTLLQNVTNTNLPRFQCARPDHVQVESSLLLLSLGVSEF